MSIVQELIVERVIQLVPQSDRAAVERLSNAMVESFALKEEAVTPAESVSRDAFTETNISLRELIVQVRDLTATMNERFAEMNRRFDDVNKRFDDVNKRFDDVNKRFEDVNKRFDDVNKRFAQLTWIVTLLFGSITVLLTIFQYFA